MVIFDPVITALVCVIFVLALLAFMAPTLVRSWKYNQLKKQSNSAVEVDILGWGTVHIHPMPAALQVAVITDLRSTDKITLYSWIISECVEELHGLAPFKISMDLAPVIIDRMGEAVLDVSGMTEKGQKELEKKSEATAS